MKPIKLHKPLLDAVRNGLVNIFTKGSYADKEVQRILKSNKQFGSKDRSFIAETIYDMVRWQRNYESFINMEIEFRSDKINFDNLLLLSFLNRKMDILNPELLDITIEEQDLHTPHVDYNARLSFPQWLDKKCYDKLGNEWPVIAEALNAPAKIYIRTNTIKTTTDKLLKLLEKEGVETAVIPKSNALSPFPYTQENCIEILSKNNLKNSRLYKDGLFEFQDLGSQIIGEFCGVKEKLTVLDLCAGAGGKSLHLSSLMKNTGKIYATDYNSSRLENLQLRSRQAGCRNIEILSFDKVMGLKNIDVLLIDAPCSGLGTIRRHPDLKWKLSEEDIEKYIRIQSELLASYKHLLHPKGKMVYATCSILPTENQNQVRNFLDVTPGMILKRELHLQPHVYNSDGFYMADIQFS